MKKLKMLFCLSIAWKFILAFPVPAHGQENSRVSVEVNYLGGDLKTQFDYPKANPSYVSGKKYDINGLQVGVTVAINDRVAIGGRMEENLLRRTRFFHEDKFGSRTDPDSSLQNARSRYQEAYTDVVLPKMAGHRLIAGAARTQHVQEWEFTIYPPPPPPSVKGEPSVPTVQNFLPFKINSRLDVTSIGPMIGIEGGKSVGRLGLNWSGRVYPRMANTDRNSSVAENGREQARDSKWSSASHGFELRGVVSYKLADDHVAIQGGYQYRQLDEPDQYPSRDWVVNETNIEKGFLGGLKFTF